MNNLSPRDNNNNLLKPSLNNWDIKTALENFFNDSFLQEANNIKTDIKETDKEYIVVAEIPGAKKEDIKINFHNDMLTISYESKQSQEVKQENYIRKERHTESISRSYHIGNIDIDKVTAKYDNGLLSIILPKKEGNVPTGRNILID